MKECKVVWLFTINVCLIIICIMLMFMLYKQSQVLDAYEDAIKGIYKELNKKGDKNGKFVCSYGRK